MSQIKILGELKKVTVKSKATNDGDIVHSIDMSFELLEGVDRTEEIIAQLKAIQEITLDSKQPTMFGSQNQYKDDTTDDHDGSVGRGMTG